MWPDIFTLVPSVWEEMTVQLEGNLGKTHILSKPPITRIDTKYQQIRTKKSRTI